VGFRTQVQVDLPLVERQVERSLGILGRPAWRDRELDHVAELSLELEHGVGDSEQVQAGVS
jgi:hypothetical protein